MSVIDSFFEKINNLPMLPKVVQEVMHLVDQGDADIKTIASVVNRDQVLAARVLKLANSAYFGCSRHIKTIDEAVGMIGMQNLKTLVVASGVTTTFSSVPGVDLNRFWQHSLVTASVARHLSQILKQDAEIAYLGGLMHSIGQLPIHLVFPAAGAQVEEVCRGVSVLERATIEQSILGVNHCQIGGVLTKLWSFPEEISKVILYYSRPLEAGAGDVAPLIYAAVHIAYELEQGKEADLVARSLNQDVAATLGLSDSGALVAHIEDCLPFIAEAKAYL